MINREAILKYMNEHLGEYRVQHCLGVEEESVRLAKRYGCDEEKAALAGLMHDCAKWMSDKEYIWRSMEYGIAIDDIMLDNPSLLHGSASAHVMKHVFGITDQETLDAVCYHCIARADMRPLDMVVAVADLTEQGRDFDGVDAIRQAAKDNLTAAYIKSRASVMQNVAENEWMMHPSTVHAYNKAIMDLKNKE